MRHYCDEESGHKIRHFTISSDNRGLTLQWDPFPGHHHHVEYRRSCAGSDGTHHHHSRRDDKGRLEHSSLHRPSTLVHHNHALAGRLPCKYTNTKWTLDMTEMVKIFTEGEFCCWMWYVVTKMGSECGQGVPITQRGRDQLLFMWSRPKERQMLAQRTMEKPAHQHKWPTMKYKNITQAICRFPEAALQSSTNISHTGPTWHAPHTHHWSMGM